MQTLQIVLIMSCRTWTSSTSFFIQLSYILSLELFQSSLSILWIDNVKNYRTIFFLGLSIMVVCLMFPHKIRCRYCISDNNLIDLMLWSSHCRLSGSTCFFICPIANNVHLDHIFKILSAKYFDYEITFFSLLLIIIGSPYFEIIKISFYIKICIDLLVMIDWCKHSLLFYLILYNLFLWIFKLTITFS